MILREQDKHFLWALLAAIGVIFVWKGLWEGIYEIPYVGEPWVALFLGFAMLTFSGLIFREFDPLGGIEKSMNKVMHEVSNHPEKKDFRIKYYDKSQKKEIEIRADRVQHLEKGSLILKHETKNQEVFIPMHRVTEITHKGKTYWRL